MTTVLPTQPADWRLQAACLGHDPEIWHPVVAETGAGPTKAAMTALVICNSCTVRAECRDAAIRLGDQHGIWGGMVPTERAAYAADRGLPLPDLTPNLSHTRESQRTRTVRVMRDAGQSVESIAAYCGVAVRTVQRWLALIDNTAAIRSQLEGSTR